MIKTAVVTGYAGFIGSALTEYLLSAGWYVYGIDKLTYAANKEFVAKISNHTAFTAIHEDITNITFLPSCDVIFNLAAESDVDNSNANSYKFVQSNIAGVQNLLSLITNSVIIKQDKPLFFQMSTDEVYGELEFGAFNESGMLKPSNPYSATKAAADLLIESWARTYDLEYLIARPSNNYGFNQYPEKLIPLCVKQLMRGKTIKLHNKGTPVRSWTHVEDTIKGIILMYESGVKNDIYNLSSGFMCTNLEVVSSIIKSYHGYRTDIIPYIDISYDRPGQDFRYSISSDKIKKLGWKATHKLEKDIPYLVKHYKSRKHVW
jgi:dTDP-glucose 4,6-dehydratase